MVFAKGEQAEAAREAGADLVGQPTCTPTVLAASP